MTKSEVRIATEIIEVLQRGKSTYTGGFFEKREGYWLNEEQYEFLEPFFDRPCILRWGFYQPEVFIWRGTLTFEDDEKHLVDLHYEELIIEMLEFLVFSKNRIKYSDAIKEPTKIS